MPDAAGAQADTAIIRDLRGYLAVHGDPEKIAHLTAWPDRRLLWMYAAACLLSLANIAMAIISSDWLSGGLSVLSFYLFSISAPYGAYYRSMRSLEDRLGKFKNRVSHREAARLRPARSLDIRWLQALGLLAIPAMCGWLILMLHLVARASSYS